MRAAAFLLILAVTGACAAETNESAVRPTSGKEMFIRLGKLTGSWSGTTANGHTHRVNYRYSAGGSVLVETWTLGAGRESMTLYALDGERLLATHYCPQGNQPRLEYTGTDASGRAQFRFIDGTNLHVPGQSHQQAFWLHFDGQQAFSRGETYVENDTPASDTQDGEAANYARVAD